MNTYTITPLKWSRSCWFVTWQRYEAETPFGRYAVERYRGDVLMSWEPWRWEYCFAEYYDEGGGECRAAKEGKAAAEQHWLERISGALTPATARISK